MHHGVARDDVVEVLQLLGVRQFAVQQQIGDLDMGRFFGQLLDRIAAIQQHALIAVDVGDLRRAVGRRGEARIVGECAGVGVDLADVDHVRPDGAGAHRRCDLFAIDAESRGFTRGCRCGAHVIAFPLDRSRAPRVVAGGAYGPSVSNPPDRGPQRFFCRRTICLWQPGHGGLHCINSSATIAL